MKKILVLISIFILSITLIGCTNNSNFLYSDEIITIKVGERVALSITGAENSSDINWSSSNESIAAVDELGIVTGVNTGMVTITGIYNNKTFKKYISVDVNNPSTTIEIIGEQTLYINESLQLNAKIYNTKENQKIIWESNDEKIATVDENGLVSGIGVGIVKITAKAVTDKVIEDAILILVRSNKNILDDSINNYIESSTVEINGSLDLSQISKETINVINKNYKSTIGVSNYQYYFHNGKQTLERVSIGTGVIFFKDKLENEYVYYALTNYHVIKDNAQIKAYLGDLDIEINASQVVKSDSLDLAIIAFRYKEDIPLVKFGKIENIEAGQFVIALGNPNGYEYYGSATFGMISYASRKLDVSEANFIQHDAAINPGNSGGPLFNLNGEMIGINTVKLADETIDNMGFSIAIDTIQLFVDNWYKYIHK